MACQSAPDCSWIYGVENSRAHARQVFDHVIEYLRTVRFSDAELPLPRSRADLALLLREANFYGLPGLSVKARSAADTGSADSLPAART